MTIQGLVAQSDPRAGHYGASARWMYAYLLMQMACQVALLIPGIGGFRPVLRSAAFCMSLAILVLVRRAPLVRHRIRFVLWAVLIILGLSALNPEAGGLAALASFCMQLAILAPVFWVARLRCGERELELLLILFWGLSTANAAVGLLQVSFPGRFQASISEFSQRNLGALMIQTASGAWIPRPMGLTDTPGGAAAGGLYATLLGLGIAIMRPFRFARLAAAASALIGMSCLYLCRVRSLVVMLAVCLLGILALFAVAGRVSRFAFTAMAAFLFFFAGLGGALTLGGPTTLLRFESLLSADPRAAYQVSRGEYLDYAFDTMLPKYPLGAGLGRWGMMANYFGSGTQESLSAEIQWLAWVIDGGFPLLIAYPVALGMTLWNATKLALRRTTPGLEGWATVIAGYSLGSLALTFSYPIFMSAIGLEFWLVNAALIQAAATFEARARARPG
jgi:hypothetical protein